MGQDPGRKSSAVCGMHVRMVTGRIERICSTHLEHSVLNRRQSTGAWADSACLGRPGIALSQDGARRDDHNVAATAAFHEQSRVDR